MLIGDVEKEKEPAKGGGKNDSGTFPLATDQSASDDEGTKEAKPLEGQIPFETFVDKTGDLPSKPAETKKVRVTLRDDDIRALRQKLLQSNNSVPAKAFLLHHRPQTPNLEKLLQNANFQLQQLNQNVVSKARNLSIRIL